MNCWIDASSLRPDRMTGIERYTSHVVHDLPRARPAWEWTVLVRDDVHVTDPAPNVRLLRVSGRSRARRELVDVAARLRGCRADLVHFPGFPPPLVGCPRDPRIIVTVHDANYWRFPQTLSRGARLYYKPSLSVLLRRGRIATVLAHSLAAADDVRAHVPSAVQVVGAPLGVASALGTHGLMPAPEVDAVAAETSSHGGPGYLLAVGTVEPRKNYATLFAALELLVARGVDIPPLRIVGRRGWGDGGVPSQTIEHLIEFVGTVDDSELQALYRGARAFVIPSLYEGFGLPLLEAMRVGRVCVASDIAALREVGGDAVRYAPARSVSGWAEAIEDALLVTGSQRTIQDAAVRRADLFTWTRWAEATLAAYELAAAGSS
jgi:glycosyltransferase involved in cell wall biosynthesis